MKTNLNVKPTLNATSLIEMLEMSYLFFKLSKIILSEVCYLWNANQLYKYQ